MNILGYLNSPQLVLADSEAVGGGGGGGQAIIRLWACFNPLAHRFKIFCQNSERRAFNPLPRVIW